MDQPVKSKGFPLPSSLSVVPGTERAQAAYPYYMQFKQSRRRALLVLQFHAFPGAHVSLRHGDRRSGLLCARLGEHPGSLLPTTLGIDYRIINGRVYIGGNAVTDPAEIARRTDEFRTRAFYYYENWERLYAQWREKMLALIADAQALPKLELPEFEPLEHVTPGAASPRTTISSTFIKRRSRAISACGTTISSSCCSAMART